MNSEQFDRALDEISDGLIDAAACAYEKKSKKKKLTRLLWAACIGLVVIAAGLLWDAPTAVTDPTQPTISIQNPTTAPTQPETTEPTTQLEKEPEGTKIVVLSTKNGEETEIPLEVGITTPIDYVVYARDLSGLDNEERSEVIKQWREFDINMRDNAPGGYQISSYIGNDVIVGTYMNGFLGITPSHSKIISVSVISTNGGDRGWGRQGDDFYVSWFFDPDVLIENPGIPLSSIRDSLEVTIAYEDGTTERIVIDISLDDEGHVYATLAEDSVTA